MDPLRQEALWQLNLARVYNDAIEKAKWRVWELRNENRYVLALTQKEIMILRSLLSGESLKPNPKAKKLAIRDQIDDVLDDEDSTGFIVDIIGALSLPLQPPEVEALFERRYKLIEHRGWPELRYLTSEEQSEYDALEEKIRKLPFGKTIQDDEASQSIREAAALLKKHKVPGA